MFKTKNPFYKTLVILSLVFLIPATLANVYIFLHGQIYSVLSAIFALTAGVSACYYIIRGFSKDQAKVFHLFTGSFAAAAFFSAVDVAMGSPAGAASVIIEILSFGFILVMSTGKDMGKLVSLVLCAILIALEIARLDYVLTANPALFSNFAQGLTSADPAIILAIRYVSHLCLALALFVCTYAKYVDKVARGREV